MAKIAFQQVTIVGIGLLGSSLGLALKRLTPAPAHHRLRPERRRPPRGQRQEGRRSRHQQRRRRRPGLRPGGDRHASPRHRARAARDRAGVSAGHGRHRHRLDQAPDRGLGRRSTCRRRQLRGRPPDDRPQHGRHARRGRRAVRERRLLHQLAALGRRAKPSRTSSRWSRRSARRRTSWSRTSTTGLVASISHLPYVVSTAIMRIAATDRGWREAKTIAAGGFATATHLTDGDPRMFADICLTNREQVARQIDPPDRGADRPARGGASAATRASTTASSEAREMHDEWLAGRSADERRRPTRTADLKPSSLFFPAKLGELLRRGDKKEVGGRQQGSRQNEARSAPNHLPTPTRLRDAARAGRGARLAYQLAAPASRSRPGPRR